MLVDHGVRFATIWKISIRQAGASATCIPLLYYCLLFSSIPTPCHTGSGVMIWGSGESMRSVRSIRRTPAELHIEPVGGQVECMVVCRCACGYGQRGVAWT